MIVEYDYTADELAFLLAHDSDPFNRWEAGQRLATRELLRWRAVRRSGLTLELDDSIVAAFARVLTDKTLSPAFRELALILPSEAYLAEQMAVSNPAAVHTARQFVRKRLAAALKSEWLAVYEANLTPGAYEATPKAGGHRALKNLALSYLAELDDPAEAVRLASAQYAEANNMTDRAAALSTLLNAAAAGGGTQAQDALEDFYRRFENEPLVIDKWFALQATQRGNAQRPVIEIVRKLMAASGLHPEESESRPLADLQLLRGQPGAVPRRGRFRLRILGRTGDRARCAQSAGRRASCTLARTVAPLHADPARRHARGTGKGRGSGEVARRAGNRRKGARLIFLADFL